MNEFIPKFLDISDWELRIYQNTTGTRSKRITINPATHEEYFLKGSKELETGEIRYPTEFWSEIVSSKIGQILGFNMLDYNIAYHASWKQKIGCLSKSMVTTGENKLTEGKVYLTGHDIKYNPEKDGGKYTFSFIRSAFETFQLYSQINPLIEIIIFDSIISNSDRHQENWGLITHFQENPQSKTAIKNMPSGFWEGISAVLVKWFTKLLKFNNELNQDLETKRYILQAESAFLRIAMSPIYDSGCCLGRELTDDKIKDMLRDENQLNSYMSKGVAEIRWTENSKKPKHFDLIQFLKTEYDDVISQVLQSVQSKINDELIRETIFRIDENLPTYLSQHKLTEDRKELMYKLVTLRLKTLLNN